MAKPSVYTKVYDLCGRLASAGVKCNAMTDGYRMARIAGYYNDGQAIEDLCDEINKAIDDDKVCLDGDREDLIFRVTDKGAELWTKGDKMKAIFGW